MAAGISVIVGGVKKTAVMPPKVIVGGAKKNAVKVHVIQSGAKKLVWQASTTDWDFHTSGIAASADPTTVSWGYTATASQLLYFACEGAMTQITPSGWTKILAPPVGDIELAVFRKTAAGGETGITVDHNGPRKMAWGFWAFPVGSAHFGSGTSDNRSDNILNGLSGLPGTPITVLYVATRPCATTTGESASATWGVLTELFDNHEQGTGSQEGAWLTGAAAQDYTGTTISPTWTPTGTGGAFVGAGRYHCGWAVSPP